MTLSSRSRKPMPAKKPMAAGSQAVTPCCSAMSMAGIISDQTEAAIITPEAKPSSSRCRPGFTPPFRKNTKQEPNAVPRNGISMPMAVLSVSFTVLASFSTGLYHRRPKREYRGIFIFLSTFSACAAS